jgi:hypothetical protein
MGNGAHLGQEIWPARTDAAQHAVRMTSIRRRSCPDPCLAGETRRPGMIGTVDHGPGTEERRIQPHWRGIVQGSTAAVAPPLGSLPILRFLDVLLSRLSKLRRVQRLAHDLQLLIMLHAPYAERSVDVREHAKNLGRLPFRM